MDDIDPAMLLARIAALEAELANRSVGGVPPVATPPTDQVIVEPPPVQTSPFWFATVLNLPSWMTDADDKETSRVTIYRRDTLDVVMMPGGAEEIVLVTDSGSHMQELLWQDLLSLRKWKERGGPRWVKGLGVNLHRGEPLRMCPLVAVGTPSQTTYEQPWGSTK